MSGIFISKNMKSVFLWVMSSYFIFVASKIFYRARQTKFAHTYQIYVRFQGHFSELMIIVIDTSFVALAGTICFQFAMKSKREL